MFDRLIPFHSRTPSCVVMFGRSSLNPLRCQDIDLFTPGQLALRIKGALLLNDSVVLSTLGISFSSRGSQLQQIYLYVPHLIS